MCNPLIWPSRQRCPFSTWCGSEDLMNDAIFNIVRSAMMATVAIPKVAMAPSSLDRH